MDKNFPDSPTPLTVSSLMRSMLNPDYPSHIVRLLNQVKGCLNKYPEYAHNIRKGCI